ncbi:efflux RND transporter permease subunit [Desulfovibrio legallii]|uniref:Cu(I)/Ag(I) efflux system membrane protein CusA/SilA n=1 Tax=Desulfovibrio legallii TaxID=571438 RepID=A0A1G7PAK0_9BACT|nr:efflux RND transporter permease subunit [Desulfovibrio legallii]SDF83241.1 Cu(I)/Ag(I) efflux system membrane protein CusA/SilA [Desulfovibrio legallii]
MIGSLIRACVRNRFFVLLGAVLLAAWGAWAVYHTPVDALPDLSDTQVIIRTSYPGKAPQLVEDQITYPLTTAMLSVPGATSVRGYSSFGDSYVYVIFNDNTDLYWARSRVLEYLNQVQSRLPDGVTPSLGPDATGIGWIYEYALVDKSGKHDLAELRSLQDWMLKFELAAVPGVAEVASVGGVVREYQIVADPVKLAQFGIPLSAIASAVTKANQEAGGSVIEQAEAEYMVRAGGYLKSLEDFRKIVLKTAADGTPVYLEQVAAVRLGPEMRRGLVELNGQGEVAGGIVLLRSGENARAVIAAVREKLAALQKSLPEGVEIVTTYDRSQLIQRAVDNLTDKLKEEFLVVAVVCVLFLLHLRSAMVAVLALPLALCAAFIVMYYQGISANIMSLGGIAIAVGAMVDASVVMVENAHRKLRRWEDASPGETLSDAQRWEIITDAAVELGPALFVSLLIITLSFIPVFALEGQEGKMFRPLALTKLYAMGASALLSVTVIPVLTGLWVRGRIPSEEKNPISRFLIHLYNPAIRAVLRRPRLTLAVALLALLSTLWPLARLGGEFLPHMDEGDLLYMPSTLPGVSVAEVGRILQLTDKMIKTVPEVDTVFGKAGRAETATDPAPVEMLETTIRLKPREQWRKGMTIDKIIEELDAAVRLPGMANLWVPPIRNRIDMTSTGVKSPIAVKVSGADMAQIDATALQVQHVAAAVPGVVSALAESLTGGRYVDVRVNREQAARFGMNVADVQLFISSAVGGEKIGETVEGVARYPINLRYPQQYRDSVPALRSLPVLTPSGEQITLGDVADVRMASGPTMLKSEQARLAGWVYIDARGRDMVSVVRDLDKAIREQIQLPAGVSVSFTGQYAMLERATERLSLMVPATLLIIFLLLYMEFRSVSESLLIMLCLPFSLVGGVWFMYLMGYALSVATGVGYIALAGLAAEFGVVMLIYIKHAVAERPALASPQTATAAELDAAIHDGAVLRVRPKAMTAVTTVAGLLPIFWTAGTGSEIMTRIAAPMFGGMISAAALSMFILPAAYKLLLARRLLPRGKGPVA